ncbi:PLP-dependent aminotransferase family protein [Psychrobacillus glaciei]|uniref:PLP-dependent aminotransferase family protein n=1 Tax=Psychrobacillus glaciei TaxID=2283160 RepID=A0A5J6SSX2_9BACI|nr:PLP-dependent aminotransferase family protein [Psychrobacillus glaciei]QFF99327.1 PLP-dependent aminotransferase family protein [Psychrobacillus glaciei]
MKELILHLHENSPKYKQIYHSIRSLIENNELHSDTKLPSIRQLADSLHVSRNTTLVAYEQLLAEGYIRSEQKRGYFVETFEPIDIHVSTLKVGKLVSKEINSLVDFRAGSVDQQAFPLKAWRQCANEVLKEDIVYMYGEQQGDRLLREKIANYLLQSRGIRTSVDSIVIGSSTQQLLMHLSIILKKEFSSIAVENPGYDGARIVFQLVGFQVNPIDVTEKGLCMKQFEQTDSKLVYITPSHQFPTGVTLPIAERLQLLKWSHEQNGYIIEDDYDSEFRYQQQPIPALLSIQQEARVIYISTFSKAFLPSIRLSYMVLPSELLDQYKQQFATFEQTASSIHQRTMARFMERGRWDSHIRKMRATYKRKMDLLVTSLQLAFGKTIRIIGSHSGLYILIQLHTSVDEETLIQQAIKQGVKVYPTSHLYIGNKPNATMLKLGFSNLSIEEIQLGVQLLKKAWT